MLDTTPGGLPDDMNHADLGPLAWVFEELRKSLEAANKAIKRFVRESEASRRDDLEAVDPSSLRIARQQLHQAVGALEMVGLGSPAHMLRAMEAAVGRFVQKPLSCTDEAAGKIEKASFALIEYLEATLNNKSLHPVALYAQYRDVQELAGAERVHPADLWSFEQRSLEVAPAESSSPLKPEAKLRSILDRTVLLVVKTGSPAGAQQLVRLCANLSAGADSPRIATFWRISAAYFEAFAQGLLPADVYVKRAASRILMQFASLTQGQNQISETLLHDLLFFCWQAVPGQEPAPHLSAVREAFGLDRLEPVDYNKVTLGRYDPAVLAQARKRINSAKESWSLFSGGDNTRARQVLDQFGLIGESLLKLHPASANLAQSLVKAVDQSVKSRSGVRPELSMEVATTTLYLEAAFEDFDPNDPELVQRTNALSTRLEAVMAGEGSQPLESWMEQLYRRVSDRQTMGSVVGELKVSLAEAEKVLDQFFRTPHETAGLHAAVSHLQQMRGVLSVLGFDEAVSAVGHMRQDVEAILLGSEPDKLDQQTHQLADNLSALSFLVDMLSYQPAMAKKLFAFDESSGELRLLMGRVASADSARELASADAKAISERVQQVVSDVEGGSDLAFVSSELGALAEQAGIAGQPAVAKAARDAAQALVSQDAAAGAQALVGLSQVSARHEESMAAPAPEAASADDDDDDLLDIFLEEAREVVVNGREAIQSLRHEMDDLGHMTTLRRAFHTLKGSSRMVGLEDFGEAAWAMEQVLNEALAEQKPAHVTMLDLAEEAMVAFGQWVEDIAAKNAKGWRAQPFKASALAWRERGIHLPLNFDESINSRISQFGELTSQPADLVADIDLGALADLADASAPIAPDLDLTGEAVQSSSPAVPSMFGDISLDLDLPDSDVGANAEGLPAQSETLESAVPDFDVSTFEVADTSGHVSVQPASAEPEEQVPSGFAETMPFENSVLPEGMEVEEAPASALLDFDLSMPADVAPETGLGGSDDAAVAMESVDQEPLPEERAPADLETSLPDIDLSLPDEPSAHESGADDQTQVQGDEEAAADEPPQESRPVVSNVVTEAFDDQTKVIGPLRVPIRLYNVYLNEADEWSRKLNNCLTEWALERHEPLPDKAEALAHSLAGSSATVGFQSLSTIARALEHALGAASLHQADGVPITEAQAELFVESSEEIRRLLHQFAAGFYKEPTPALMDSLDDVVHSPAPSASEMEPLGMAMPDIDLDLPAISASDDQAQLPIADDMTKLPELPLSDSDEGTDVNTVEVVLDGVVQADAAAEQTDGEAASPDSEEPFPALEVDADLNAPELEAHTSVAEEEVAEAPLDDVPVDNVPEVHSPGLVQASALGAVSPVLASLPSSATTGPAHDVDDDIDAVDMVDADLFPIFEEEALELLPQLGAALRQWRSRPGNTGARTETLRHLHTLKGSARLAGALRLGEMVHRMETDAERLGSDVEDGADIEPLLASFDAIEARFDALRQPDAQAPDVVQTTPEQIDVAVNDAPAITVSVATEESPADQVADVTEESTVSDSTASAPMRTEVGLKGVTLPGIRAAAKSRTASAVRVRPELLDRMMMQTGEVMISRSRMESEVVTLRNSLKDLTGNLDRLRQQLRDIELQAESQMQSRLAQAKDADLAFDPLEFDRFTRVQELTRMMAESVNDVATVQRNLQRSVEATEDGLVAQARQARELQGDLLRTRMVEFEGISERLYRVVRQSSKETGKQVRLDITGGSIEMDRGVLDRMTAAFEHLLRNCVVHGVEMPQVREGAGKSPEGQITIALSQELNDVSVVFEDDGAGVNLPAVRAKAEAMGLVKAGDVLSEDDTLQLLFHSGMSTADEVSALAGRGVGMDVVRNDVIALGGRIETETHAGKGTRFKLVLPLTTAVTQVVMVRAGKLTFGVPSNLVQIVRRVSADELAQAYQSGQLMFEGEALPFHWSGALLQSTAQSEELTGKTLPVIIFRSAAQRVAVHVDEVLGNQEVVVKNLGPQLSRLPGLAGMTILASGAVALIYNPVALSTVYGDQARQWVHEHLRKLEKAAEAGAEGGGSDAIGAMAEAVVPSVPLVLVVDDSITVRRVTQRLLVREGYRVALAADGLQALERLQEERPTVVLSDIEMPRMDGFDLVRNIRADAALADLPVIMITSRIAEKHREHARELGVDHYLGKPYSEDQLLSLIAHYAKTAVDAGAH